jgi:hypothetical protein
MADTAIAGDDVEILSEDVNIVQTQRPRSAMSWSAAIAGAIAATAISFILIALGSGIGLAVASPYAAGPSLGTMTVAGAVWLVLTQAIAFAAGGMIAGRLRGRIEPGTSADETRFRDGANGFMAWAIGALAVALIVAGVSAASVAAGTRAGATTVANITSGTSSDQLGYFVDTLLRAPQSRQGAVSDQERAQVLRILAASIRDGSLSNDDRSYLADLVGARAGINHDDAQNRVNGIVDRARASLKQTAETARKAGEYVAFWTFMSLLFGAVAATLGGILGGELRDESSAAARASLVPN